MELPKVEAGVVHNSTASDTDLTLTDSEAHVSLSDTCADFDLPGLPGTTVLQSIAGANSTIIFDQL